MVDMRSFLFVLLVAKFSFASMESIDSECRIQAKESAITTYQSCVKESRTQKIEEIRKEYQSKLQDLKSYYDGEMKKMSSSQKQEPDRSEQPVSVTLKKKGKGTSAKANGLPAKKSSGKSLPIRNIEPETKIDSSNATEDSSDSEIVNVDENSI
jgi:Skp family chaperone for outer membrane proteins